MFRLFLATLEKVIFDDDVQSLIAPGAVGYFGILTNHAPIIASLKPGKLVITDKNHNKIVWAISGGFLEMSHNNSTILADAVESPSAIDIHRAEESLHKAQQQLNSNQPLDIIRAKKAILRAENRIKLSNQFKTQPQSLASF